ncbi:hypothetical protein M5K25_022047 [Dendrobium thyrsiflorum]|uniref:Uncharacterized protein n=1 Tax=Dendrobium thyrsiflorum TaxID=117978 RepID=A0ABD0U5E7_DENTH
MTLNYTSHRHQQLQRQQMGQHLQLQLRPLSVLKSGIHFQSLLTAAEFGRTPDTSECRHHLHFAELNEKGNLSSNRVKLIKEQNTWCRLSSLIKNLAHICLTLTKPHGEQLRTLYTDKVGLTFIGNGLSKQSLTTARRTVEEHPFGRRHSKLFKLLWMFNWILDKSKRPTVSRSAEGLLVPRAVLKCSFVTAIELSTSASMVSSSKSITSIFSLMHWRAASVQSAARSTYKTESVIEGKTKDGKMLENGAFFSASSKAFLRLLSLSPANFDIISGPLMQKKKAPVSFATALAINVLPEPGGSPSQKISVSGATTQYSAGSVSMILNSTLLMPPLTRKRSPFLTVSVFLVYPYGGVLISVETLIPELEYLNNMTSYKSEHPTKGFITFKRIVSPLKSWSFSIVLECIETTELSSLIASSTTSRFGAFFLSKIAVLKSLFPDFLEFQAIVR